MLIFFLMRLWERFEALSLYGSSSSSHLFLVDISTPVHSQSARPGEPVVPSHCSWRCRHGDGVATAPSVETLPVPPAEPRCSRPQIRERKWRDTDELQGQKIQMKQIQTYKTRQHNQWINSEWMERGCWTSPKSLWQWWKVILKCRVLVGGDL